ncbi:hypothetical protein NC652_016382 [Populus alba x Populus x berolinensis]|uniref:Uncharacterized protein n=1 Tax=Populus alba x Populus x berolinensis TaxID=444605 RepID=A0AAD6QMH3_9ROSI|nr:hypothetical protein NC652_016382 [Populus alba x Populus x berolinensis]KAJ6993188.1 hypothetical protein NC653_016345 [Populus alba x Populus x berolinensis]
MATRGLIDLMSGFMYAYQNSARRSMGFSLMKVRLLVAINEVLAVKDLNFVECF